MNKRLKILRKTLDLTQQEFADRIHISRNNIASYETGKSNMGNSVFSLICREFNVNEEWLRTGTGEMFKQLSKAELAARMVGNALSSDDEFVQNVFIALGELTPNEWQVIKKVVDKIKGTK